MRTIHALVQAGLICSIGRPGPSGVSEEHRQQSNVEDFYVVPEISADSKEFQEFLQSYDAVRSSKKETSLEKAAPDSKNVVKERHMEFADILEVSFAIAFGWISGSLARARAMHVWLHQWSLARERTQFSESGIIEEMRVHEVCQLVGCFGPLKDCAHALSRANLSKQFAGLEKKSKQAMLTNRS